MFRATSCVFSGASPALNAAAARLISGYLVLMLTIIFIRVCIKKSHLVNTIFYWLKYSANTLG